MQLEQLITNAAIRGIVPDALVCERKKRATEAMAYNGLVQSWPEITRLAREEAKYPTEPAQAELM